MSDETYEGWANRETWAFWLHVTNDQGWYHSVREYAAGQIASAMSDESDYQLGEGVVEYVRETMDELEQVSLSETYSIRTLKSDAARADESVTQLRMMRDEIGSWWRIDHAEIGAAARELASDQ